MIFFTLELNSSLEMVRRCGFWIFSFLIKGDNKIIIELLKKLLGFKFARIDGHKRHILKHNLVGFDIAAHLRAIFIAGIRQIKEMAAEFLPLNQ